VRTQTASRPAGEPDSEQPTAPLTVALIEDHPLYREALERVIGQSEHLLLQTATASIEEFDARSKVRPDVVIADLHLPGLDGAAGIRHLTGRGLSVLVLSASLDGPVVVEAIAEGARGYLSKDAQRAEIVAAVRTVGAGRSYVSPTLAGYLVQTTRRRDVPGIPELSDREREVLGLLAGGGTDQYIARTLCISVSTVRSHLDRIRDKTGRRRRADLTRFAIEQSLVEPDSGSGP
jgi:DNA-binding NarL/FixJ family response regulator